MLVSLYGNIIGDGGASALAAVLKETNITELMCAAPKRLLFCQRPCIDTSQRRLCSRARSLGYDDLGPEEIAAIAEGLKGNLTLQVLE